MAVTKKNSDGKKRGLPINVSSSTHKKLIMMQGLYQAKHLKKIWLSDLAGLALDELIDQYQIK